MKDHALSFDHMPSALKKQMKDGREQASELAADRFFKKLVSNRRLVSVLREQGYTPKGEHLELNPDTEELPAVEEMVERLKGWYGVMGAREILKDDVPSERDLSETSFIGFDVERPAHEAVRRFVDDALPAMWSERIGSFHLTKTAPEFARTNLSHRAGSTWESATKVEKDRVKVFAREDLTDQQWESLLASNLLDPVIEASVPEAHAKLPVMRRVEVVYQLTEAVDGWMARDLVPDLESPRTVEERWKAARAYEAALVRMAWSVGTSSSFDEEMFNRLVEVRGLSPVRARAHADLAKKLLPLHVDLKPAQALERRKEWMNTWREEAFEREVQQLVNALPDRSLGIALRDRCMHWKPGETDVDVSDGHRPELPDQLVVPMEAWSKLLLTIRRNLEARQPVGAGTGQELTEVANLKIPEALQAHYQREVRHLISILV